MAAVERARAVGVCTLNEFRLQMGLHAWGDFSEMTQVGRCRLNPG